jgi:hypothetical protein
MPATAAAEAVDPRDSSRWAHATDALAAEDACRALLLAPDRPADGGDAAELLEIDARRAALASLLAGTSAAALAEMVQEAAACGVAAVLAARFGAGSVVLRWPQPPARVLPARADRNGMHLPRWALALALAGLADDGEALAMLAHPAALAACQEPPEVVDPFRTLDGAALAALWRGEDAAAIDLAGAAMAEMAAAAAPLAPASLVAARRALMVLVQALGGGDGAATTAALAGSLAAHRAHWGGASRIGDSLGLLAFEPASLAMLARHRGIALPPTITGDALVAPLLGLPSGPRLWVAYRFVPHRLQHDGEAHWFLDLRGFPRQGRRHQVLDHQGHLWARYEAQGAGIGVPRAEADFLLDRDVDPAVAPPLAVDAGELLGIWRDRRADRADEAREALRAALQHIPPGADAVPPATITSVPGQRLLIAAPECFTRRWMDEQLGASMTKREASARASALGAVEVIRAQLEPLLHALGQDRDGTLHAALKPRAGDAAKAFLPPHDDRARVAYDALWAAPPPPTPAAPGSRLVLHLAPAGMLHGDNELSRPFPSGYRRIAGMLNPHRVWACWKLIPPGRDAGMAYDGLVWLDDHWAWYPKPYRWLQ